MTRLVAHFGLARVSDKVRSHAGANTAIELIFGKSQAAKASDVDEGFKSYLSHLVADTQGKYRSPFLDSLAT